MTPFLPFATNRFPPLSLFQLSYTLTLFLHSKDIRFGMSVPKPCTAASTMCKPPLRLQTLLSVRARRRYTYLYSSHFLPFECVSL